METINPKSLDGKKTEVTCDVCIVGGGTAGIYLGVQLVKMGLAVVILEAGGRVCADAESLGFEAEFNGTPYRGAIEGRAFGLGGTTSRWGGLVIPHSEQDCRSTEESGFDPWQHIVSVVDQYADDVYRTLGFTSPLGGTEARKFLRNTVDRLEDSGIRTKVARYLPFRQKNFSTLLDDLPSEKEDLTIFLNAVAREWQVTMDPDGKSRVTAAKARCGTRTVTVTADSFVLAAGAIESARILLEMERQLDFDLFQPESAIGHYLGDHLSCSVATVRAENWEKAVRLFQPRFAEGRMCSFRFLDRSVPKEAPRAFAHFVFDDKNDGFELAKKVLRGMQSKSMPDVPLGEVVRGASGISQLAWQRLVNSRLHISNEADIRFQLDIEQEPNFDNKVILGKKRDESGRPVPLIEWGIREADYEAIRETTNRFLRKWPGGKRGIPELTPLPEEASERKPHDAYHPVGICRLGTDGESVVDPELKVHGTKNLSVLSTGIFPSAGTANPTFSMLCFSELLARCLKKKVIT
jgi:choline dehydrogenase-like flavoprotein